MDVDFRFDRFEGVFPDPMPRIIVRSSSRSRERRQARREAPVRVGASAPTSASIRALAFSPKCQRSFYSVHARGGHSGHLWYT